MDGKASIVPLFKYAALWQHTIQAEFSVFTLLVRNIMILYK